MRKGYKLAKQPLKKQHGGQPSDLILAEDGEVYKDFNGAIREVRSFSHDDPFIETTDDRIISNQKDGGEVIQAQSIASASYDYVKSGDRKNTKKERALMFKPKDSRKLFQDRGMSWFKTNKDMSPSELIKEGVKQSKEYFLKDDGSNDLYSQNSQKLNLQQMPSEEDIYDLVFEEQESKKSKSGINFSNNISQYGGSTYVQRPIKNPEAEFVKDDVLMESTTKTPIMQRTYVKAKYPETNVRYIPDNDWTTFRQPDGTPRAYFDTGSNTAYISKNSDSDLASELAHAEQLRDLNYNSAMMERQVNREIRDYGIEGRYEVPGTFEYNAHKTREPRIQKDFEDHTTKVKRGAQYRTRGGLEYMLGRKNVHPTVREEITRGYQYGGEVPESLDGLYKYPNQPVVVPSGDITMEGIDYPVEAYDANTGQYLNTMQPDMKYKFKTDKVLEIPKAQSGMRNADHYRKLLSDAQAEYKKYDEAYTNAKTPSEKKLAELRRQEAYNTVEYLSKNPNLQPPTQYSGATPWNPLDDVQPADEELLDLPDFPNRPKAFAWNPLGNRGVEGGELSQPVSVPTTTNSTSEAAPIRPEKTSGFAQYNPNNLGPDGTYTVGQGDWLSAIASNNGLTLDQLLAANPNIADKNRIDVGDKIIIPGNKSVDNSPSTSRIEDIDVEEIDSYGEMMKDGDLTYEMLMSQPAYPEVDPAVVDKRVKDSKLKDAAQKLTDGTSLGRLNRNTGTNALRAMMRANRTISLPYRAETPNRLFNYAEEDASPYLDEIDSAVNQQLQLVNQNTSQGQAIANSVMSNALMQKRQTLNRVNSMNLQRRSQIGNMNTQMQNQFDMMQEQNNANYVEGVNQTIANYDRNKVQEASYLDDMINQKTRQDNALMMMGIKYNNFKIDPVTGEIIRENVKWNTPAPIKNKAKWGLSKKKGMIC